MFGRKTEPKKTPETVGEAIAPFAEVRDNLIAVMGKCRQRKEIADKRIADAETYLAEVKRTEESEREAAEYEIEHAAKIEHALNQILGAENSEQ